MIPVATRSKAWVCGHSTPGIAGSNPAGEHEYFVSRKRRVVHIDVSATGRSLIQRGPTKCVCVCVCVCVTECDHVQQ